MFTPAMVAQRSWQYIIFNESLLKAKFTPPPPRTGLNDLWISDDLTNLQGTYSMWKIGFILHTFKKAMLYKESYKRGNNMSLL